MGWKDWDRTNKVVVSICAVVALAVIATFAVLAFGPKKQTPADPPLPPPTAANRPGSESPTPSPSPTYQCTTASGPDCTKDLADKEAARDKAYADAEARYRQFHAERVKLLRAGGQYDGLPKVFKGLTNQETFDALNVESFTLSSNGWSAEGPTYLRNFKPSPRSPKWPAKSLELQLCQDESFFNYLSKDGTLEGGGEKESLYVVMEERKGQWIFARKINLRDEDLCA